MGKRYSTFAVIASCLVIIGLSFGIMEQVDRFGTPSLGVVLGIFVAASFGFAVYNIFYHGGELVSRKKKVTT